MVLAGWRECLSKAFFIPQRYVLGVMGLFALANAFTMRVCLSLAITQMVSKKATSSLLTAELDPDTCPGDGSISNATSAGDQNERYDWDEATQGFLLSAFYYGYVLTHIPGGMLAQRFGGKWTLGLGMLTTIAGTLATPWAVNWGGAYALWFIRFIEGAGEGPVTPAMVLMLARWAPPGERSALGAMCFGGAQLGNILANYAGGLIMADGGDWANVFYFFGILGIIWFIFWCFLCYSTPNSHPFISDAEREYLNTSVVASGLHQRLDPVPWSAILRSAQVWVLVLAAVGHDWGYFAMITDLPKYMTDVLRFNVKQAGTVTSLPYIAMWIFSFVLAGACDLCITKGWHSITTGRKLYTTISSTGPAICIILASYSGCDRTIAVALFVVSMALMGGFYSSVKINAMDLAPNYAGTVSALVNGLGAASGIVTPYLIGYMTPDSSLTQWRNAFWTVFAVLVGTNIIYVIWGSGEQQWWDDVRKIGYPTKWKRGTLPKREEDLERKTVTPKHDHSPVRD